MSLHDHTESALAAGPLDTSDAALLRLVRLVSEAFDPLPPGLVDRLQIGLVLEALSADLVPA